MWNINCIYLALFLLVGSHNGAGLGMVLAEEPAASFEPPFPTLFYDTFHSAPIWPQRAKISTEVIGGDFKRTNIEFIDLDAARAAFMVQNVQDGAGYEVFLTDAHLNKLFKYRPYTCESLSQNDEPQLGEIDNWSCLVNANPVGGLLPSKLRMFGVGALWSYAAESGKTYSRGDQIYSASKDFYRLSHTWTVADERLDLNIRFFFVSATFFKESKESQEIINQKNNELSLEMIEIESRKTGKVLRTINVLSIEYELNMNEYANILNVPIGYGCETSQLDESQADEMENRFIETKSNFWTKYLFVSSKVELEVTATKVDPATSKRSTDTLYAEVAHIKIKPTNDSPQNYDLLVSKVKSQGEEMKKVENHLFNVRYLIDLQRESCTMSHMEHSSAFEEKTKKVEEKLLNLKFSNGLELALGQYELATIFASTTRDFNTHVNGELVLVSEEKRRRNVFLEKTIPWPLGADPDSAQVARLIRTYTEETTGQGSMADTITQLDSVTIWVLEEPSRARILQIYHFNLIDMEQPLRPWPHVPQLFDVSQECYLDNENMLSGSDYAWVEFHYPLSSRQLDMLAENEDEVKELLYESLVVNYAQTAPRLARLELMFSDEGLVARALLLDLPDFQLLYESFEQESISIHKDMGELETIAPDLRHCAKLCRQYDCQSMSYCRDTRCLLGMELSVSVEKATSSGRLLKPDPQCTTYSPLDTFEGRTKVYDHKWPLKELLGKLSHHDYDTLELPQKPEELTMARSETGISDSDYKEAVSSYTADVYKYLRANGEKAPFLTTITIGSEFLVLLPSRFVLENDPLESFGLAKDDGDTFFDAKKVASFFNIGEHISRLKFNAFQGELRDKASLLTGLSYDQCALGCVDSGCGVFSYCSGRKECILSRFDTITEAHDSKLIELDHDCQIMQRDFAKNYQKFPNCEEPNQFHLASFKKTESDCALACIRSTNPSCMSFEFCQLRTGTTNNCFIQLSRQAHVELFSAPREASSKLESNASSPMERPKTGCDHYERSSLAEFNLIESRRVGANMLDQLKTTEFLDASTPMDCADVCLNQLNDCSAFQFCFDSSSALIKANQFSGPFEYSHFCLTIQSKPADAQQQNDFEALIDSKDGMLAKPNKYLEFDRNCHLYALRPDTIQAHLRDLAMGNTMSITERSRLDKLNASKGLSMSWVKLMLLFLSVAICSSLFGVAICYAREKNHYVRAQLDRLAYQVDRLRSRAHL